MRAELGFTASREAVFDLLERHPNVYGEDPLSPDEQAQFNARLELREQLNEAIELVASRPSRFGGQWIDYSTGGLEYRVVTASSTTAADIDALAAALPPGAQARLLPGAVSWRELTAASEEAIDTIESIAWAHPDAKLGAVLIGTRAKMGVTDLRSLGVPVVVVDSDLETAGCVSRLQCESPWRGGTEILSSSSNGTFQCTWGFIGRPTTTSSTRYLISAGHCAVLGASVKHYNTTVTTTAGVDRNTFYFGPGNVRSDSFRAPILATTGALNTIFRSSAYPSWSITSYRTHSTTVVGDYVCFSGLTSGYRCGSILQMGIYGDLVHLHTGAIRRVTDMIKTSMLAAPGDSGAPVFGSGATGNRAWGIVVARDLDSMMFFSPMSLVMTDMSMRLCLSTSCS